MAEPIVNVLGTVAIKHCGEYDATMHYEKLNVVTYDGSSYCAKDSTVGNLPTDTTYWDLMAEKGDTGATPVKGVDYYTEFDKAELKISLSDDVEEEVEKQIGGLVSTTPLAVSSISSMTDTTRIYVNTTDGNWYYYDGDSWEIGGTYQSTGISDGSINPYSLDSSLKQSKVYEFGEPVSLNNKTSDKFMSNNSGKKKENSNNDYAYYTVSLDADTIYSYTGYNQSVMCGIIVCDSENNILFNSNPSPSSGTHPTDLTFKTNQSGLTAYLSVNETFSGLYTDNAPVLTKLINVKNKTKLSSIQLLKTIENKYIAAGQTLGTVPNLTNYSSYYLDIYKMNKGETYYAHFYNWSSVAGLNIIKNDNTLVYTSSASSVGSNYVWTDYEFTAQYDGYIIIGKRPAYHPLLPSISIVNKDLGIKKWYALGDSLTEKNFRASSNYVDYVTADLGVATTNLGGSGRGYMHKNSNKSFIDELDELDTYSIDDSVITIMGSINDYEEAQTSLGELGDTTTDTLYGCMYNFYDTLFTKFEGIRVGIILPPPTGTYSSNRTLVDTYNTALKKTAELFNIPVLDLTYMSNLRPWVQSFREIYYEADGTGNAGQVDDVHPNSLGHKLFYRRIREFIKTL